MPYIGNPISDFNVSTAMLNTDSVTSIKIDDGTIVNADINDSAAIAGSKISPSFTSDLTITDVSPAINFTDSNNDSDFKIIVNDGKIKIQDTTNSNAVRFFINSSGTVDVAGNLDVGAGLDVTGAITGTAAITLGNGSGLNWGDTSARIRGESGSSGLLRFDTNSSEAMRIDSSGRLLVGTTTASSAGNSQYSLFEVNGNTSGATGAGHLTIKRGTASASTSNGDTLGRLIFSGLDGGDFAYIQASVDADTTSDFPGRLMFWTCADGASSATERLRIKHNGHVAIGDDIANDTGMFKVVAADGQSADQYVGQFSNLEATAGQSYGVNIRAGSNSTDHGLRVMNRANNTTHFLVRGDGNVGIGTSTINDDADHCKLVISGQSGTASGILIFQDTSNNEDGMIFADDGSLVLAADRANATSGSTMQFRVDGSSEKMRIDSSGNVYFGVTSTPNGTSTGGAAFIPESFNRTTLYLATTANSKSLARFHNENGQVGVITVTGSSTAYTTSSDYRLKENITAISDAITRLKTLKPCRFNFKADASTTVDGFLAHEVTAVPEAITGTKDEVDADNKPIYQGIDQSKLVPLLVAALQEAISKIETLETKVAALEAA